MGGPLAGVKVLELAGIGPGPFCGMVLSDFGADVVQVHRSTETTLLDDPLERGRRSIVLDLKQPAAVEVFLDLAAGADVVTEGLRPGVAERLGIGPEQCRARNERLVYGRMTGWGRTGPYADKAGHDINYIALAGALDLVGRAGQPPTPPANLIGDFGGGGMLLALGIVAALFERERSGRGQVVDAAMVDGAALLLSGLYALRHNGRWEDGRGTSVLNGGSARYETYETADGKWLAVGAMEDRFFDRLLGCLGLLDDPDLAAERQTGLLDLSNAPATKAKLAAAFCTRTRDEWLALLEQEADVCVAPVLSIGEAAEHPHNRERGTFVEIDGVLQAAPAPRFDRTPAAIQGPPRPRGADTEAVLREAGLDDGRIAALREAGALA